MNAHAPPKEKGVLQQTPISKLNRLRTTAVRVPLQGSVCGTFLRWLPKPGTIQRIVKEQPSLTQSDIDEDWAWK
jgi:hypothetical protein